MFRILFKKELLENIQNHRFLLALVLCLVIVPLGFYVNQKDYTDRRALYEETVKDYDGTRTTVVDLMRNGGAAFRPPAALGLLAGGIEMVLPNAVETKGYISNRGTQVQFNNGRRLDNPFLVLYGRLDLVFIVSVVLSVLVMIFAFNAVAGEKERRTLAQVMANPVSRPTVIAAKMAAGGLLISVAFLAGVAAGVLLLAAAGLEIPLSAETAAAFGIGIGASLLYLLVFLSLGLLVSSLSRSSLVAMVVLLSCWVALFMILPKGSVAVSKLLYRVKSQQVVDLEKARVRLQSSSELEQAIDRLMKTTPVIKDMSLDDFMKASREKNTAVDAYENAQDKMNDESRAKLEDELDRIDADFELRKGRQAAVARTIARLSPMSCLVHVLTELAGTGFAEERAWRETRARFKRTIDRELGSKMEMRRFGQLSYGGGNIDRSAPAPKFPPDVVSLEKRLAAVWVDLALLGVYGILFFAGAYVAFLRYDVR
jgi:ABC-type transport system involved in multi-copper enzyme maturation permease subunit